MDRPRRCWNAVAWASAQAVTKLAINEDAYEVLRGPIRLPFHVFNPVNFLPSMEEGRGRSTHQGNPKILSCDLKRPTRYSDTI